MVCENDSLQQATTTGLFASQHSRFARLKPDWCGARLAQKGDNPVIRITAQHVYALRNSTGKPFTDLLDRLIRCSAATLGIQPSSVLDNPRTSYPDGGVDTQVTASTNDPRGYIREPSIWQYKAVDLTDLTDNKVKNEICGHSKDYARSMLQQGYAYRMCVAHDGSAERKTEIKALLDAEIERVNPAAPKSIVLFASDVVEWVNTFPAIAADMLGSSMKDFFHFATWQNRERAETNTFVPTQESAVIFDKVQRHLDWTNKPTTARLTVSGDAGVGKSRTVFEAIATSPEFASLTLYSDDEDKALDLARAMANHQDLYAVLVADECPDEIAFRLAKILKGVEDRVRLITIDNALESVAKSDLRLKRMSTTTVENILEINFPHIDQNRRYRYSRLAEGYLRFAILLCSNDALIMEQGHLGELLKDTRSYLGTLFGKDAPFGDADLEALMVISLVERCGVTGNVFSELEQLCLLTGLDPKDVRNRLHRMQKANGLVARAGRYFYVTPTPIAMVCFHKAWSKWAEVDPNPFLENFPTGLVPSFLARMARAPEAVGKVVNAYFQNWELARGSKIFTNADETEQFLLLVRSAPDQMMPRLRDLVVNAAPEQLGVRDGGGRRHLVVEASEIAAFPQWFLSAEDILFTLARHETEPGLGNSATEAWAGLFPIMSHVATPFGERLAIIRTRGQIGDIASKLLCIEALVSALDDRRIHIVDGRTYGQRIAPTPWSPKTYEELNMHIKECLAELRLVSLDTNETIRDKGAGALIRSIRSLVIQGLTDLAREGAGDIPLQIRPVLRAELREISLLNNSNYSSLSSEEAARRSRLVDEWVAELAPTDLHARLVEEVGPDSWDHHLEQTDWEGRIRELVSHLLQQEDSFEAELPWLSSDKARSSVEFGVQLGRLDKRLQFLDRITDFCAANRNPNLARGYFAGVSEVASLMLASDSSEIARKRLNESLDRLWESDPILAFHVMMPSGDFVQSFARAIAGVREKRLPASFLHTAIAWNGPRRTLPAESRLAAQTLLMAAREGDNDAAGTGIEFVIFVLRRATDSEDRLVWLQTVFEDEQLDVVFGLLEQATLKTSRLSYWFSDLFARVVPANPDRAVSILIQMMQEESYETSRAASDLFGRVAAVRPLELMNQVGKLMLSRELSFSFLFTRIPILSLPDAVIVDWLGRNGLEGARVLASHLPAPMLGSNGPDLNPICRLVLEKYGDDDGVFSRWVAGMHNGRAFAGSIADYTENRASMAEPFLDFPISAVRRWAKGQIMFASENVERFRLSEEEAF